MCSLMEHSARSFREKMAELETADREKSAENLLDYPANLGEN